MKNNTSIHEQFEKQYTKYYTEFCEMVNKKRSILNWFGLKKYKHKTDETEKNMCKLFYIKGARQQLEEIYGKE